MFNFVKRGITIGAIAVALVGGTLLFHGCERRVPEVRLAAILPLTGELAEFGADERRGMELAATEINQEGGIRGRQLAIIYKDSRSDASSAVAALQQILAVSKPPAVFSLGSTISLALAPIVDQEGVVLVAVASTPDLKGRSPFVFRNFPAATTQARELAEYAFRKLRLRGVAVLHINDDLGNGNAKAFVGSFERLGGKVLWVDAFSKDAREFRGLASKVVQTSPPAVYVPGYGDALALLVKQIRELGYRGRILSSLEFGYPNVLALAGPAAEGVIFADVAFAPDSEDPALKRFVGRFRARYKRAPTLDAVLAYDGLRLLAYVMEQVGEDPSAIADALRETENFRGITGPISVQPDGDFVYPVVIKVIRDGKPKRLAAEVD